MNDKTFRLVAVLTFLVAIFATAFAQDKKPEPKPEGGTITVAWDDPPGEWVAAYRVYYGCKSRNYTNTIVVSSSRTTLTIPNLVPGEKYYMAVTTVNRSGVESDYSKEISDKATIPALKQ